jgi:hypothetical protein
MTANPTNSKSGEISMSIAEQQDMFAEAVSQPLADFWATSIAQHVVAMANAADAPASMFPHSTVRLFGIDVKMHIGPHGVRGLLREDWRRILDHLQEVGAGKPDLAVFSFGVLQCRP